MILLQCKVIDKITHIYIYIYIVIGLLEVKRLHSVTTIHNIYIFNDLFSDVHQR